MAQVNLLRALPGSRRNVKKRGAARTPELLAASRQFGELYFDGPREYGYGGYRYDGRWIPVARDIISHFGLKPGMRVLDVGCAKGFLVGDLMRVCPGLEVFGLDISEYALRACEPGLVGRLHLGNCHDLPFADHSFDVVISINTIHNLERPGVIRSLQEIVRVTKAQQAFVQADSYHSVAERQLFEEWVLTAKFHDFPEGWHRVFEEAGYRGDWDWTILTE
jgi:ubiquinone/menaquinone biosynthesis C-methylase UbiE